MLRLTLDTSQRLVCLCSQQSVCYMQHQQHDFPFSSIIYKMQDNQSFACYFNPVHLNSSFVYLLDVCNSSNMIFHFHQVQKEPSDHVLQYIPIIPIGNILCYYLLRNLEAGPVFLNVKMLSSNICLFHTRHNPAKFWLKACMHSDSTNYMYKSLVQVK